MLRPDQVQLGTTMYYCWDYHHADGKVSLAFDEFRVEKINRASVWITNTYGMRKIVYFSTHRQYAWLTKEEAVHSLKRRRERQLAYIYANLDRVQATLAYLKSCEQGVAHSTPNQLAFTR